MSNINELRNHLFDAITKVKTGEMSIEQAKVISDLSQTVINTAKLELDYERYTDNKLVNRFINPRQDYSLVHKMK